MAVRRHYNSNINTLMNHSTSNYVRSALFCSVLSLVVFKAGGDEVNPVSASGPGPVLQPAQRYPDIDWPLSVQQVRSLFFGSALNLGSDDIERYFRNVLGAASSLLLTDTTQYHIAHSGTTYPTVCIGDTCELTIIPGDPVETVTVSDALDAGLAETQSVMRYQDVHLVQGRAREYEDGIFFEHLSYGGWQDHHIFSAQASFVPGVDNFEQILVQGYSIGSPTGTDPVSGSGIWRGVMVGIEAYRREDSGLVHHFLQGDAELVFSLDYIYNHSVAPRLSFTNIRYLDTGESLDDISWRATVLEDGKFWEGGFSDTFVGYFYGPEHEEAGGVFETGNIKGAFALERVPGPSFADEYPEIDFVEYVEGENPDEFTSAEITEIYQELGALVENPEQSGGSLLFNDDAEFEFTRTYRGISFAQGRYASEPMGDDGLLGYGGWLEYSFFGVETEIIDNYRVQEIPRTYSFGDESGTNPTPQGGSGTWTGAAIGYDRPGIGYRDREPRLLGDARITISDFTNPSVDATINHITWAGIPLTDGSFNRTDALGEIEGRFYGPHHEEVGGTFVYERALGYGDQKIYGAFGASRNE